LRKLRLAAAWNGDTTGWQMALVILSIFIGIVIAMPVFVSVLVFIIGTPHAWEKLATTWGMGFRGLLVFVPLLLAVRAAAARWLTLPIADEFTMRRVWARAFGTQY
jgi:hypothetical protein